MSGGVDLLGDPLPEPLPEGQRFSYADQLVGHTILAVFESPTGRRESDLVIVTETKCWIAFCADTDGCGDDAAYLKVVNPSSFGRRGEEAIHDFVSAQELFQANCISHVEFQALKEAEEKRENERKAQEVERLRVRLAKLEGTKP